MNSVDSLLNFDISPIYNIISQSIKNEDSVTIDSPIISLESIQNILMKLRRAKELNQNLQQKIRKKIYQKDQQIEKIEQIRKKAKIIIKSKQKKHVKYPSYTPLESLYMYSPKKTHLYYLLLDNVISLNKKNNSEETVNYKTPENRYNFTKENDKLFNEALLNSDISASGSYNWFGISDLLNKASKNSLIMNNTDKQEMIYTPLKCFVRYLETSSFYKYKKWTNEEDQLLRRAILYYGPKNWQQISYCLNGRNNSQCFHRWMKGINPKIKRSKWSFMEDLYLGIALNKIYVNQKWSKIACHLSGRTDIQCRERWCNILDPSLEEINWNKEEDKKLIVLYDKYGKKWSLIAKVFGNRTDNTIWRRWKVLMGLDEDNKKKSSDKNKDLFKIIHNKDNNA